MPWQSPPLPWSPSPPALPTGSNEVPLVTTNGMRKSSLRSLISLAGQLYHSRNMSPAPQMAGDGGPIMMPQSTRNLMKSLYHPQIMLPARYP